MNIFYAMINIMIKNKMNINMIVDTYYPESFHKQSHCLQEHILSSTEKNLDAFNEIAKQHNLTLEELLDKVYNKTQKYPFFVGIDNVSNILKP
jgi:hypothetical protein